MDLADLQLVVSKGEQGVVNREMAPNLTKEANISKTCETIIKCYLTHKKHIVCLISEPGNRYISGEQRFSYTFVQSSKDNLTT